MRIFLKPIGDLRDYFGREPLEMELPDNATAKDLLTIIGERLGRNLPAYLWDSQQCAFRGAVYLVVDNKVLQNLHSPLHDGIEIVLLKALSGG